MNDKPANRHRDLRSLIRDDAYAASFQSLGQYRTALLEYVSPDVQGEPLRHPATPSFLEYPSFDESANFDPVPDVQADEWIPNSGKKPDLPDGTLVDVKFAGGFVATGCPPHRWMWTQDGDAEDITDYRIHRPAPDVTRPAIFSDEDHVYVPRGLVAAACSAIDLGVTSSKLLAELRRYTVGDLSRQAAPDVAGLERALKSMVSGYMRLLQSGYDRITDLGGDCDPVDVMERDDAYLREARATLATHRKQGG